MAGIMRIEVAGGEAITMMTEAAEGAAEADTTLVGVSSGMRLVVALFAGLCSYGSCASSEKVGCWCSVIS
jgi:hypothetical protein